MSSCPHRPDPPTPAATLAAVEAALAAWQAAHPQATFAEVEAAVEAEVARLRASLLGKAMMSVSGAAVAARPTCTECTRPLVARGRHRRTVRLWGDQAVDLERTYWTCPHCGAGHFPPG